MEEEEEQREGASARECHFNTFQLLTCNSKVFIKSFLVGESSGKNIEQTPIKPFHFNIGPCR